MRFLSLLLAGLIMAAPAADAAQRTPRQNVLKQPSEKPGGLQWPIHNRSPKVCPRGAPRGSGRIALVPGRANAR